MTPRGGLDRRGLLRAAGVAAALAALPIAPGCGARRYDRPTALARAYFEGDPDGAAVVGAAHAASRGGAIEAELAELRAHLASLDEAAGGDDDVIVAALADEVAAELRAGDTSRVDGWTCAPTELRLAALVSLGA